MRLKSPALWLSFWALILCHVRVWPQYIFDFEKDWESGLSNPPGWIMEQDPPERWERDSFYSISGIYSLHHAFDNPGAGCDHFILRHPPWTGDSIVLSFRVRHASEPSSSNNWQVAMLARNEHSITEGLVLGVNYSGSDDLVKLWGVHGGTVKELCTTDFHFAELAGIESAPLFKFIVRTTGEVTLSCFWDPLAPPVTMSTCYLPAGEDEKSEYSFGGRALVVRYEYSSSRDRSLWIDDLCLEGAFTEDTVPPSVEGYSIISPNQLMLVFSEILLEQGASFHLFFPEAKGSYSYGTGMMLPDSVRYGGSSVNLHFPGAFPNRKEMELRIRDACDPDGNCLADTMIDIMRNEAEWGDVVFNEVMFDPEPEVDLSLGEYLELFNRSGYPISLAGWRLLVGDGEYGFPDPDPFAESGPLLEPGSYFLFTETMLPNGGETLSLYSSGGELIHAATYRIPFHGPEWKKDGGWSIESPCPGLTCVTSSLWEFSTDRSGGTPGRLNSVNAEGDDREAPILLYHGYGDPGTVQLKFSETVRFPGTDTDYLTPGVLITPGNRFADSVVLDLPLRDGLTCYFPPEALAQKEFRLRVPALADCSGNLSGVTVIRGGAVPSPVNGSVLVSEIMYDPLEGAPEFIELYNPGSSCADLGDLALDISKDEDTAKQVTPLFQGSRILEPEGYLVVTRDVEQLRDAYHLERSGCWLEMDDLGNLPDGGGKISLMDRTGKGVDEAVFSDSQHMDLIEVTQGISLERISWDRHGTDPGNWHSAASIEGYCSPGSPNSQSPDGEVSPEVLFLDPEVFSPDNDGSNDLLGIFLSLPEQGSVIRLWITDLKGNPVRILANNHVAGPQDAYYWDGEKDNGGMAAEGFYVVHFRGYHSGTGSRWNRKAAAGLVYP